VVGAYRPDDVALGRGGERHPLEPALNEFKRYFGDAVVDLDKTTADRGQDFVEALLDRQSYGVGDEFRRALYTQTNGHALFTVEILHSMQETGALVSDERGRWVEGPGLDWSLLPARVEGVIEERIARLQDDERDMLRVASVEGEQFTAEVVASLRQADARAIIRELSEDVERQHHLVRAEGVRRVRDRRLSLYRFLHNMIQRYLYHSLGEAERAYLHEDVGKLLEGWFSDSADEIAVQLAHHFERAGDTFRAVRYLLLAGNRARRMSANQEAQAHLSRGLQLVQAFPEDSLERVAFELGLQAALGATLIALQGYASAEVGQAFARARELCRAMHDPPGVMPVLLGLALYYLATGAIEPAQEEGERLLALAEGAGDHAYLLGCHVLLAATTAYLGQSDIAQQHCEQVLALYRPVEDRDMGFQQGQDPAVVALSYRAWLVWRLGYPEQAAADAAEAVALAERIGHPFSQALALGFAAITDHFRSDWTAAQAHAEQALALARREHFPFWEAMAQQMLGTSLARRGHSRAGIALLQQGMAAWEKAGTRLGVPMFTLSLAEAYFAAGNRGRALALVDRSLREAEETKQRWWSSEQHRLRGLILADGGDEAGAADWFRKALDVARSQRAPILELRAVLSLAKAALPAAEKEQARCDLAAAVAAFPGGESCPELGEARAVLGG
jgi:predicted ATPase